MTKIFFPRYDLMKFPYFIISSDLFKISLMTLEGFRTVHIKKAARGGDSTIYVLKKNNLTRIIFSLRFQYN
jgi:hypothetical protein